ncbi:MAG: hypothetical protein ACRYF3_01235 [Janthinobacterium lividum]
MANGSALEGRGPTSPDARALRAAADRLVSLQVDLRSPEATDALVDLVSAVHSILLVAAAAATETS